jgi:hypothetical protein
MYGYPLLTFNSALRNFKGFTFHSHYYVQGRLCVNNAHSPTKEACRDVMQPTVWQECYRLKRKYFSGIPAKQIRMTSPISCMNDAQWCELVKIWSSAKNKVCEPIDFLSSLATVYLCCSLTQIKL